VVALLILGQELHDGFNNYCLKFDFILIEFGHYTSMPPVGFEPTISAGERPQTYTLGGAATGTGSL
jgi:hypothetical protein